MREIIIIEDDEDILKFLKIVIDQYIGDINIITEKNGSRGLELIKSGNPDLIILDILIPVKDGIEICKELRNIKRFEKIPIIAFTSITLGNTEQFLLNSGFDEYIPKGIKIRRLVEIIKKYLTKLE